MLDLYDPMWKTFAGGYRVAYDASACLIKMEAETEDRKAIWEEFWQELHHQGDVGIASYAAIPHVVRICIEKNILDWNMFALIATVEECHLFGKNPPLPDWLAQDYLTAIKNAARFGAIEFAEDWPPELTRTFLSVAAFANGLPNTARTIITFGEDEINEAYDAICER